MPATLHVHGVGIPACPRGGTYWTFCSTGRIRTGWERLVNLTPQVRGSNRLRATKCSKRHQYMLHIISAPYITNAIRPGFAHVIVNEIEREYSISLKIWEERDIRLQNHLVLVTRGRAYIHWRVIMEYSESPWHSKARSMQRLSHFASNNRT